MKKPRLKERITLLMQNEEMKVYVDIGPIWLDPTLYMEIDGELIKMTISSGEYENDLGEFFLYKGNMHLNKAIEVMNVISDSIVEIQEVNITKFTLKKEYLKKLKEVDNEAPRYI